MGRRRRAAGDP